MRVLSRLEQAAIKAGQCLFVLMMGVAILAALSHVWPAPWGAIRGMLFTHLRSVNLIAGVAGLFLWGLCFPREARPRPRQFFLDIFLCWSQASLVMILIVWTGFHLLPLPGLTLHVATLTAAILAIEACKAGGQWLLTVAGRQPKVAVILGSGRRASKAWKEVRVNYGAAVRVLGFADDREPSQMAPDIAHRLLCDLDGLRNALIMNRVDQVYIAMPVKSCYDKIQRAIDIAGTLGIEVMYMEDVHGMTDRRMPASHQMFRSLSPSRAHSSTVKGYKGFFDFVGALLGLVVFAPLGLVIALGIKLTSPGSILLAEERYGLNGRRFRMLRFRTIAWPLQAMPNQVSKQAFNQGSNQVFSPGIHQVLSHQVSSQGADPSTEQTGSWLIKDPRHTRLGRFLCATSLDEVAQLWNVLMGDMSLVGPRPLSIHDALHLSDVQVARHLKVKPGITGLWQVSGRSALSSEQSAAIDSRYIDQWSLAMDLRILLRTLPAVAKRDGAA